MAEILAFHKGVAERWDSEWEPELKQLEYVIDRRRHLNLCISRYLQVELTSREVTSTELFSIYLELAWREWMEFDRWGFIQKYLSREMEFLELAFDAYMQSGKVDAKIDHLIGNFVSCLMREEKDKYDARAMSFMQQVCRLFGTDNLLKYAPVEFERYCEWYMV